MVALNFHADFVPKVEDGSKPHTFRVTGKRPPPREGQTLHLYTRMRHPGCRLLKAVPCTRVQPMSVWLHDDDPTQCLLHVHGVEVDGRARERFAVRDGFASWAAFVAWLRKTHKPDDDGCVHGHLIWWGGPAP